MIQQRGLRKVLMKTAALTCAACLFMGADIRIQAKDSTTAIGNGIDVSSWQEDIDWNAVAASGVQFAFIRVGSMKNGLDVKFNQNMTQANAAGIKTGVYIYSYATNAQQAAEEAAFVLAAIQNHTVSMPVVIDIESEVQKALTKNSRRRLPTLSAPSLKGPAITPWYMPARTGF